jgi:hypothetical protein
MSFDRETWVADRRATTGHTLKTLTAIARDGDEGTANAGAVIQRRHMSELMADNILHMIGGSGIQRHGLEYLVALLRWHYGYHTGTPIPPGAVRAAEARFIRTRAYNLVDEHRDRMPAPTHDREAT